MTKDFFIAIRTRLLTQTLIKFVQLWNNQTEDLRSAENPSYSFPLPAVFVEFVPPADIQQLGDGAQIYDPLIVRLHVVHEFLNNIDDVNGMMEQDLDILNLKESVFATMQRFTPNMAVAFVRVSETMDYNHNNVVEFIQDYKTNLIDDSRSDDKINVPSSTPITLIPTYTKVDNL
jgi:hypothetical protein